MSEIRIGPLTFEGPPIREALVGYTEAERDLLMREWAERWIARQAEEAGRVVVHTEIVERLPYGLPDASP